MAYQRRRTVQTPLGLTIVGLAAGFELAVLAGSAARWGTTEAAVAGVVGSLAYKVMMTLGAGALMPPQSIAPAGLLDLPLLMVLGTLTAVAFMAASHSMLGRVDQSPCCLAIPYSSPCALRDDGYREKIQHASRPDNLTA